MPSVLDRFAKYLEHSERSPLTIKNRFLIFLSYSSINKYLAIN
jgi:hypothetical protein